MGAGYGNTKSMKISKRYSDDVNRRRTYNTMINRKGGRNNNDQQNITQKTKD